MNRTSLNFFAIAVFALTVLGCKNDKKNETNPNATAPVEENVEQNQHSGAFVVNVEQSTINWRGSKPMGEHVGTIAIQAGEILFENGQPVSGKVVIDMNSITVTDEGMPEDKKAMLAAHLKGTAEGKETDFFNTPEFPTAIFEITGTNDNGELQGNLTLKEKKHPIAIPVNISWSSDGSSVNLKSEKFSIDRTKWNVNYGSKSIYDNLGDNWINDEIEVELDVKASKQ